MSEPKVEKVNWKAKQGYRYHKPLNELMLTNDGMSNLELCRLVNEAKSAKKQIRLVCYDSDYVATKIALEVFGRLNPRNWENIEGAISEAWQYYLIQLADLSHRKYDDE